MQRPTPCAEKRGAFWFSVCGQLRACGDVEIRRLSTATRPGVAQAHSRTPDPRRINVVAIEDGWGAPTAVPNGVSRSPLRFRDGERPGRHHGCPPACLRSASGLIRAYKPKPAKLSPRTPRCAWPTNSGCYPASRRLAAEAASIILLSPLGGSPGLGSLAGGFTGCLLTRPTLVGARCSPCLSAGPIPLIRGDIGPLGVQPPPCLTQSACLKTARRETAAPPFGVDGFTRSCGKFRRGCASSG
jgi:hypothetical protein